jgi:AcrR family transcriptional regulator
LVDKGFAGTSISTIATKAKVNQSLIYHHFGSKHQLWVAVKTHILEDFHSAQDMNCDTLQKLANCRDFIAGLIRYRFGLFDHYHDVLRILEWQYLEPNPYELTAYPPETLDTIIERMEYFQQQKEIAGHYNPELIFSMLLAIPSGFFSSFRDLSVAKSKKALSVLNSEYVDLCINTAVKGFMI